METDHQSRCALLQHTIQTPKQQRWLTKLLRYDFDTVQKPSVANFIVDALSRLSESSFNSFSATIKPIAVISDAIRQAYTSNSNVANL